MLNFICLSGKTYPRRFLSDSRDCFNLHCLCGITTYALPIFSVKMFVDLHNINYSDKLSSQLLNRISSVETEVKLIVKNLLFPRFLTFTCPIISKNYVKQKF